MDIKKYITALGFIPKNGISGGYHKVYTDHDNYAIAIDFDKEHINYGDKIIVESKTTQNFSQLENFVVLECVDRLLQKGYKPQNIVLEKTWPSGHGTSGRLDICVNREDGSPYLLIECKTYGKEFSKELAKIHKDGGQLFTYFQLSGCKADVIMLYASELKGSNFIRVHEIIKIEEEYRSGEVKDIYEKWNKLTKDNGIFDTWVQPYNFQSKALTKKQLKEIKAEDSSFIFNRFLEILRHNVVSDKGNAFNKIFTLFLCKVYDETTAEDGEELKFQWLDGRDNHVEFQLRLTDLYSKGMKKFLDRTVSDFDNEAFDKRCANLDEDAKQYLIKEVNKLRLEKNNEFAIKEVYDKDSFAENAKVVKEVVELIQGYRIRYNKRQQYLSDFFELLLTTGLKQEAGQFFTPVPVAQFIIKSLPLDTIVAEKLSRKDGEILPYMIDYAAGSGHFITEFMHEIQDIINNCDTSKYIEETRKHLINWQNSHFDWATNYVYGIEKDYRLVKVGKVGCYLHGDGLANVILSDGLANFSNNKDYKGKLRKQESDSQKDNQQFDVLLSNPPYSVSSFRQTTRDYYTEQDFELYNSLTDNSSEIECLFVERTKQLLKDGGVAGIILPSSLLSNSGIYTKTREIILQYFDIVAIAELGSNTFMATNTNTVVLFLRRRDNYFAANTKNAVEAYFRTLNDVTINGIETPASKYVAHVWEGLDYADYVTLLHKSPNDKVKAHEIYTEYRKKISAKSDAKLFEAILSVEAEKLLYFILAYPQKVVLVRSGEKGIENRFLGYEFSNRRGNEGIHAIQRGKNIEECTQLFDVNSYDNPEKASSYIYKAFKGDYTSEIAESMKPHVSYFPLVDMLTFDRPILEKSINLNSKKKVIFDSTFTLKSLDKLATFQNGLWKGEKGELQTVKVLRNTNFKLNNGFLDYGDVAEIEVEISQLTLRTLQYGDIILEKSGGSDTQAIGRVALFNKADSELYSYSNFCSRIRVMNDSEVNPIYLWIVLHNFYCKGGTIPLQNGLRLLNIDMNGYSKIKIPVPPIEIQKQIVEEIEVIEKQSEDLKFHVSTCKDSIEKIIEACFSKYEAMTIDNISFSVEYGTSSKSEKRGLVPVIRMGNIQDGEIDWSDLVYTSDEAEIEKYSLKKGDILFNRTNSPELVGKVGIYRGERPAIFAGYLIRVNYKKDLVFPTYLLHVLNSKRMRKYGFSVMSKSVNQANINGTLLKTYRIPIPPIEEQEKIVSQIEALELEIKDARNMIENVASEKQAILDKYL